MIRNYITVAIRSLMRDRLTSAINIGGLAVGIACCTLMFLYVEHEWTFDRHLEHYDTIHRLVLEGTMKNGGMLYQGLHEVEVAEYLVEDYDEVEAATAFVSVWSMVTSEGTSTRLQTGCVHPDFLNMFSVRFVAGDRETALDKPDGIVLSRSSAKRIFGDIADPSVLIGRNLTYAGNPEPILAVTGIVEDSPRKSSLRFDVLVSVKHRKMFAINNSFNGDSEIFVRLSGRADVRALSERLVDFPAARVPKKLSKSKSVLADDGYRLRLQPMRDVYLGGEDFAGTWGYARSGDAERAYQLSRLALLVLAIASINFVVMSISRAGDRSLEVGVRKALGAGRFQVMCQHGVETLLTAAAATGLALALVDLFTSIFRDLSGIRVSLSDLDPGTLALFGAGILLVIGLLAGVYPSLVLAGFPPIAAIRKETRVGGRQVFTRTMVVFQYAIVIGLMICAGIMTEQLRHFRGFDLGYDKEHIVVVYPGADANDESQLFMDRVSAIPHVVSTAGSDRDLISGAWNAKLQDETGQRHNTRLIRVTPGYFETLDVSIILGRGFRDHSAADENTHIVVNESFVKQFGWEDPGSGSGGPIGRIVSGSAEGPKATVVGVCGDFHFDSLHKRIGPLMLHTHPEMNGIRVIFVRIGPDDVSRTVESLRAEWQSVAPDRPFRFGFLDEKIDRQYRKEQRWQAVLSYASLFAIAIACMGLFAQASVAMARRTKEIGIRKVVGASVSQLVSLLTREFALLVLVANLFAWPISHYWMEEWLAPFAYRIDMPLWPFGLGSVLALAIAMMTVGWIGMRAARGNPVDALRYE